MIDCVKLIGKSTVDTYYEFLFVMALGAECGRRGDVLDLRGLSIPDKGMLSKEDLKYMHFLKGRGFIFDGSEPSDKDRELTGDKVKYHFNTDCINSLYDVLVEDIDYDGKGTYDHSINKLYDGITDCYAWSSGYARGVYGEYNSLLSKSGMGNTLMHIMAHLFVCFYLGERKRKPVKFILQSLEAATMSRYLDLYACARTLKSLGDVMSFVMDENYINTIGDIDLIILYNMSKHAGRYKRWSSVDKYNAFVNYGFKEGQILVIYTRDRITDANPAGKITASAILRVDSMSRSGDATGISVTQFSLNKTVEERVEEYLAIDDEYKHIFSDLKTPKISSIESRLNMYEVGVGQFFYSENKLILPIEKGGTISKRVTIDGKRVTVDMSEIDAIYWILCQYDVDFDRDLYKSYYNDGEDLMWDKVDGTPNITV